MPNDFRPTGAKALLCYLLAECDFSKLSNKICTIDVKIHIFASSIKRTEKNENSKLWQATEPIDNHGGNMYALASCNGV